MLNRDRYFLVLKLLIEVWTRGDRLFYFYLGSVVILAVSFYIDVSMLTNIFFPVSNIYLFLLYTKDKELINFYRIFNISNLESHLSKLLLVYGLSLLQVAVMYLSGEIIDMLTFFPLHFLSFYSLVLFYSCSDFYKILLFLTNSFFLLILFNLFPMYVMFPLVFLLVTLLFMVRIKQIS